MAKINKEKAVVGLKEVGKLAGTGTCQALICGIARAILPPQVNIVVQGAMLAGGLLVGGFVGECMNGYIEDKIDSTIENAEETVKEQKENIDQIKKDIKRLKELKEEK